LCDAAARDFRAAVFSFFRLQPEQKLDFILRSAYNLTALILNTKECDFSAKKFGPLTIK
jgi:hypothetical protein